MKKPGADAKPETTEERDLFGLLYDLLGADGLLLLVDVWGGRRLKIPKLRAHSSNIAKLLGPELAERLRLRLGGAYIKVPLAKRWRISVMRHRGHSYGEIASRLCIDESTIGRTLQEMGLTRLRRQRTTVLKKVKL